MTDAPVPIPAEAGPLRHLAAGRARASVSGLAWSLLTVTVSTGLTALVFLVTSRTLSAEDFGTVAFAVSMVTIASVFVPTAFGEALIQRADLRPDHLDSVFWLTLGLGVLAFAALALGAPVIAGWSGVPILAAILPVLALRLIFDAATTVPAALILRRMQFRRVALRTTLANGAGAVVCLWMVLNGYALWALVASQVVGSAATFAVTALAARWRPSGGPRFAALAELRVFGLYAMGGKLLSEARLDQFVMGLLLGPPVLGLYFFAHRLQRILRDLTAGAFAPVTNVLMASLQSDAEKRSAAYLTASFGSAGFAFPVFAGLLVIAPTAVPLVFGAKWTEAVFAVQCLAVIGLLAGLGMMQAALIRNLGRPDWWFGYQAAMQLSTIPILLALYRFGLDAIMVALVLRTAFLWPASVRMAQRMLGISLRTYLGSLRGPAAGALVMALAVASVGRVWPDAEASQLLATQIAVGALVYPAVVIAVAGARLREVRDILRASREGTP